MVLPGRTGNSQKPFSRKDQYDVYGEVTGGSGSLANEFDFAGQQTDGTGLQYLRARYYDPATGVFLSREPMAVFQAWRGNNYAYALGNSCRFKDTTGLFPTDGDDSTTETRAQCFELYLLIRTGNSSLAKREDDYDRDYFKLPEYESQNQGRGSREGHRNKYSEELTTLGGLLARWDALHCDRPSNFPETGERKVLEEARGRVRQGNPLKGPASSPSTTGGFNFPGPPDVPSAPYEWWIWFPVFFKLIQMAY